MELAVGIAQETGEVAEPLGVAHADHRPAEGDGPVLALAPEAHRGLRRRGLRGRLPRGGGQQLPRIADGGQRVTAAIGERDPRARHQVRHRARDEHLARRRRERGSRPPRPRRPRAARRRAARTRRCAGRPGSGSRGRRSRRRSPPRSGWRARARRRTRQAVPARGQHVTAEPRDVAAHHLGEAVPRRRVDEHHGGHDAVGLGLGPRSGHQLLDLGHRRLDVADPRQMVRAGQLDVARSGDALGHVPRVRHVDRHIADSMEDHDRDADRRQQRSHVHVEHHPQQRAGRGGRGRQALRAPPCTPRRLVAGHRRGHRREVTAVTPLALEPIQRVVHGVTAPVAPDEALPPVVVGEAAPQQQAERALGVGGREQQAHRAGLRRAEERRALGPDRLHHGAHVVHPLLERRQAILGHAVGQAGAALVEQDQPAERRQPAIERRQGRRLPRHLDVGDVAADDDQVDRARRPPPGRRCERPRS